MSAFLPGVRGYLFLLQYPFYHFGLYEGANFLREYYHFPLVMDVGGDRVLFPQHLYLGAHGKKSKVFHVRGALDSLIASLIDILNADESADVGRKSAAWNITWNRSACG